MAIKPYVVVSIRIATAEAIKVDIQKRQSYMVYCISLTSMKMFI